MKKLSTITFIILITGIVLFLRRMSAQAPEKLSYQAVIRDAEGNLVTGQEIGLQISILQDSAEGNAVYTETLTPVTNTNGLVQTEW